jgi:hypothetical protein
LAHISSLGIATRGDGCEVGFGADIDAGGIQVHMLKFSGECRSSERA